jgi:hypothetical protein
MIRKMLARMVRKKSDKTGYPKPTKQMRRVLQRRVERITLHY